MTTLSAEARELVESRTWTGVFTRLEALRSLAAIELLEERGDLNGALVWLDALELNLARDLEIQARVRPTGA